MTCLYCASELPTGALFCGECGRSVTAKLTTTPVRSRVTVTTPVVVQKPAESEAIAPETSPGVAEAVRAPSTPVTPPAPQVREAPVAPPAVPMQAPAPAPARTVPAPAPFASVPLDARQAEASRFSAPAPVRPPAPAPAPAPPAATPPPASPPPAQDTAAIEPILWADLEPMEIDLEQTRIVRKSGARFVLQFSTGESVSVAGTGLIGRNPVAEPGERFDSIVVISDPGKSVSKTHLEFGQDAGTFWISDRFSGNGTTVREPGAAPRRCDAGKRYRITRGSRVDVGEQFFIVS